MKHFFNPLFFNEKRSLAMLKVFYWDVCPHCKKAMEFLRKNNVPFEALDIEKQPPDILKKVVEVNGGEDWVVPTMEYRGQWRKGQVFDEAALRRDLREWGLL